MQYHQYLFSYKIQTSNKQFNIKQKSKEIIAKQKLTKEEISKDLLKKGKNKLIEKIDEAYDDFYEKNFSSDTN